MTLKEKIADELTSAQKKSDSLRVMVLRLLNAALHNREIEKRTKLSKDKSKDIASLEKESQLNEEEILKVIQSEIKKRKEAIEGFEKGNRADLVNKEKKELQILQQYVPEQISDSELRIIVQEIVQGLGASSVKDMGKVMKEIMRHVGGRAEGTRVGAMVKEYLK